MPVPVTAEEKKSPLYKYYEMDMVKPEPSLSEMIENNPLTTETALKIQDMDDLFLDGYLPGEFGYAQMEDGTATIASLIPMPQVTVEMFDWWFAWHGLEPLRYKIWDKDEHYSCLTRHPEQSKDTSLPMKERYWNTIHDVDESVLPGGEVKHIAINFRNPADIGFSPEKLKDFKGTIVCAGNEENPVVMCHFVRPKGTGIELRTRFWRGYCIKDGKPEKAVPDGTVLSIESAKFSLIHCVKEFSNLAALIPKLYPEYKDKF